jgi:hypothetical protein
MTVKRIVGWSLALLAVVFALVPGVSNLAALFLYVGVYESLFPSTISWDAKNAFAKCPGAIADPKTWPPTPAAACEAMYLCVNEAPLSDSQMKTLYDQIRKTPGCQEP